MRELCIGVFRAGVVPSRPLAQDDSFALEDVTALATAFEGALRILGVDRSDPSCAVGCQPNDRVSTTWGAQSDTG